jgi:hypothetical protein
MNMTSEKLSRFVRLTFKNVVWIRLRHEHVVPLFGVANLLGTTVMVCPWLENGTVTNFLTSRRDLSESHRVQLLSGSKE